MIDQITSGANMTLNAYNQVPIPAFMYGTAWKKETTEKLVRLALEKGFKAIDTANQLKHYDERLVGDAVRSAILKGVPRKSLFLQTKFTSAGGQDHRTPYDASADLATQVKQSFDSSLLHLHTDYIDSYVLHGPHYRNVFGDEDWQVWEAMEALYLAGKAKMIGVSNVSLDQLRELCAKAKTKPMVVQNRCYAISGWDQKVREFCRSHKIIYQGFSLLTANTHIMSDSSVRAIAKRLGTGSAQVIFRFAMQVGMLPLTGTSNAQHMEEDLQAEKLELSAEDVKLMETVGAERAYL